MRNSQTHEVNKVLNNLWLKKEIMREIRKYFEMSENAVYCKLWIVLNTVLRYTIIAVTN